MASQHGDGWSARWTDHEGKRRRTTFRFKREVTSVKVVFEVASSETCGGRVYGIV